MQIWVIMRRHGVFKVASQWNNEDIGAEYSSDQVKEKEEEESMEEEGSRW